MLTKFKISLARPDKTHRHFSFRLKQHLDNEKSEYRHPGKIFVVSDIEGNFQSFYRLLLRNKIVNKYFEWTFSDSHLVVNGDCFDRGEQVTECLWLIYSLEEKAKQQGGYVHFILGNHEIMNMNGDWRYVHPKYAETTKSPKSHTALYGGNEELWRWLRTKNIIEKVGNILFVHAGIANEIVQHKLSIVEINALARPYYTRAGSAFTDPKLSLIFGNNTSPFWYRGYYIGTASEEQVDNTLNHFGVNTIVTGHTLIDRVDGFFNGKVINVNTDHATGKSEALLIRKDKFYRVTITGERERIK